MAGKKKGPVEAAFEYVVSISFSHNSIFGIIDFEKNDDPRDRTLIPRNWEEIDRGDYMECWIRFRNDDGEPFNPEQVKRVVDKFEMLDQACEIMVKEA